MAAYTRNPQTEPDDSPGGSTVRQGVKDQNSQAINDLYVDLNAHSNNEDGLSHAQIDTKFTEIDDPVTGIVPKAEAARDAAEASATAAALSETNAASSETNASNSEINSAASESKAKEWATNPEDDPVETGPDKFSAFHWSAKSEFYAELSRIRGEQLLDIKVSIKDDPNEGWEWLWGGEFLRADYPDAWAKIQTESKFITESAWQAKDTAQGGVGTISFFSDGDGSTTFRVPRIMDFHRGVLDALPHDSVLDSLQGHWHSHVSGWSNSSWEPGTCNYNNSISTGVNQIGCADGKTSVIDAVSDGIHGTPRVGAETAPKHWFAPLQIKLVK